MRMSYRQKYIKNVMARLNFLLLILCGFFPKANSSVFAYDKITRVSLDKIPVISNGKKCIWHVVTPLGKKNMDYVRYQDSNDTVCISEDKCLSTFLKVKNGLYWASSEDPNYLLSYTVGELIAIPYCLQLNDSVNSSYRASGKYCGKYGMNVLGTQSIKLIGIGQIVENQRDTIDNILLFVRDNIADVSISYPQQKRQVPIVKKEKNYFWIDSYSHHVVLNLKRQEFHFEGKLISKKTVCHRYQWDASVGEQKILNEQGVPSIFNYSLRVVNDKLSIIYECLESCDIRVQICDISGIMYHRRDFSKSVVLPKGELNIDLSRLRSGIYVCYVYVNGQVYSKNFNL